ncbi:hypothetical protein evm_006723 [Chilo suppressalis]|nr:hypothetical protein evm_006723 [Chilo suppressalis]
MFHARTLKHWVGLRPGRHEIRLEAEEQRGKLIVHNYGHGGSGLTLFWGCADNVLDIVRRELNNMATQVKSKI